MAGTDGRLPSLDGPVLALETSGSAGSLAVGGADGAVLARLLLAEPRRHAAELAPAIPRLLEDAGLSPSDLSAILVGEGPGSFTGVRVAAATAKGLARGWRVPLLVGSSLAAGACSGWAADAASVRYILFDARGDRVYGACYEIHAEGATVIREPHAGTLGALMDDSGATSSAAAATFAGAGARAHRGRLEEAGFTVAEAPAGDPTASGLLALLGHAPDRIRVAEPDWQPEYLRASNAERAWQG